MSHHNRILMVPSVVIAIALVIAMTTPAACAAETEEKFEFDEQTVAFHNGKVKLAGSLLLPKSVKPIPAVVFVHGAGPQTREKYRTQGEYFASQGIAALIYDKRGTGESSGVYESRKPYENLVNDALAGVALLKQHQEIDRSKIGMWGLSQGGAICASAAVQSKDVQFIVAAGSEVADGMLYYYRDNLFRRYGLSDKLRDVAEKAQLGADTLWFNLRDESLLSTFAPRTYPPPEKYVHPAWSRVTQPVLVMWGQLDQHQPVGESILGLKNSLAYANNTNWTIIVLPNANHDLGVSETGEIHRPWRGYAPGVLKTMTDWVHGVLDDPARVAVMKQEGTAQPSGVLSMLVRYENLRWYGNGTVQVALYLLFLGSFIGNAFGSVRYGLVRVFQRRNRNSSPTPSRVQNFKRGVCVLDLFILAGMQVMVLLVYDQIHPSCPTVLLFLPLLGTASTVLTIALLIMLARTWSEQRWTVNWNIRDSLDVLCLILFVPYLYYWNMIGVHF